MIKEAGFWERLTDKSVRCYLCAHQCVIRPDGFGICGVRQNNKGVLNTSAYGEVVAANIDPIEKKPLYHFLPGSLSYSIAAAGCNFKCGFCQNWQISQSVQKGRESSSEAIIEAALKSGCASISYTYTEPTIFFEYAFDTAKSAKAKGLKNIFVSNGYMSKEALTAISPYLDAINIDLKSFRDDFYKRICKARLQPVLDSVKLAKKLGIWTEITTLIIPNENDSETELKDIAGFIASVGKEIPWHISRFHPDYKFNNYRVTPVNSLEKAFQQGKKAGLRYVYLGNLSAQRETLCYNCGKALEKGAAKCPGCRIKIDGVFS